MVSPCSTRSSPTLTMAVRSRGSMHVAQRTQQSRGADAAAQYGDHLRNLRGASVTSIAVSDDSLVDGWPGGPSAVVLRLDDGARDERVAAGGRPRRAPRLGLGVQDGGGAGLRRRARLGTARLHRGASGRAGRRSPTCCRTASGPRASKRVTRPSPVGTQARLLELRRSTSRSTAIVGESTAATWLDQRVFRPLRHERDQRSRDARASGVVGLDRRPGDAGGGLAATRRRSRVATRDRMITPYLPRPRRRGARLRTLHAVPVGTRARGARRQAPLDGRLAAGELRPLRPERLADAAQRARAAGSSSPRAPSPSARGPSSSGPTWTSAMRQLALAS